MDLAEEEMEHYVTLRDASTSFRVIPTIVDVYMPGEEVEDDEARVERETIEIVDTDDDTVSLPPEDLPENFVRSLPEDQKSNKREHEDDDDLESCKKQKNYSDTDDEGNTCPICLDAWSISGEHRVCCLSCGHLFGHSCLLRWLQSTKAKLRKCPTCKRKVSLHDIRFLYVKKLVAIDSTDLEILKAQLVEANKENNSLRTEFTTLNMQKDQTILLLKHEIHTLKTKYQNATLQQRGNTSNNKMIQFSMDKSLEISDKGGCRVCDYNPMTQVLCVSAVSPNPIFSGFGVRKIAMTGYRTLAFIPMHVKAIRDLTSHVNSDYLLSVSLDAKAKITSMFNNQEVMSFNCEDPLWSCCWDANDCNVFYVGHSIGCVSVYDIRNPGVQLTKLETAGDGSPVVSLASTQWKPGDAMRFGGLLCCKLNSCWAFEKKTMAVTTYENRPLGLEGPFMSLRYNTATKHILVSARPNQRHPYTRHTVCEISQNGSALLCNTVHTFVGAKAQGMLSRSCLLSVQDQIYTAAYNQADNNVSIWSLQSGNKVGSVPAHFPILDSCSINFNNTDYLATLNEKKLDFFKVL